MDEIKINLKVKYNTKVDKDDIKKQMEQNLKDQQKTWNDLMKNGIQLNFEVDPQYKVNQGKESEAIDKYKQKLEHTVNVMMEQMRKTFSEETANLISDQVTEGITSNIKKMFETITEQIADSINEMETNLQNAIASIGNNGIGGKIADQMDKGTEKINEAAKKQDEAIKNATDKTKKQTESAVDKKKNADEKIPKARTRSDYNNVGELTDAIIIKNREINDNQKQLTDTQVILDEQKKRKKELLDKTKKSVADSYSLKANGKKYDFKFSEILDAGDEVDKDALKKFSDKYPTAIEDMAKELGKNLNVANDKLTKTITEQRTKLYSTLKVLYGGYDQNSLADSLLKDFNIKLPMENLEFDENSVIENEVKSKVTKNKNNFKINANWIDDQNDLLLDSDNQVVSEEVQKQIDSYDKSISKLEDEIKKIKETKNRLNNEMTRLRSDKFYEQYQKNQHLVDVEPKGTTAKITKEGKSTHARIQIDPEVNQTELGQRIVKLVDEITHNLAPVKITSTLLPPTEQNLNEIVDYIQRKFVEVENGIPIHIDKAKIKTDFEDALQGVNINGASFTNSNVNGQDIKVEDSKVGVPNDNEEITQNNDEEPDYELPSDAEARLGALLKANGIATTGQPSSPQSNTANINAQNVTVESSTATVEPNSQITTNKNDIASSYDEEDESDEYQAYYSANGNALREVRESDRRIETPEEIAKKLVGDIQDVSQYPTEIRNQTESLLQKYDMLIGKKATKNSNGIEIPGMNELGRKIGAGPLSEKDEARYQELIGTDELRKNRIKELNKINSSDLTDANKAELSQLRKEQRELSKLRPRHDEYLKSEKKINEDRKLYDQMKKQKEYYESLSSVMQKYMKNEISQEDFISNQYVQKDFQGNPIDSRTVKALIATMDYDKKNGWDKKNGAQSWGIGELHRTYLASTDISEDADYSKAYNKQIAEITGDSGEIKAQKKENEHILDRQKKSLEYMEKATKRRADDWKKSTENLPNEVKDWDSLKDSQKRKLEWEKYTSTKKITDEKLKTQLRNLIGSTDTKLLPSDIKNNLLTGLRKGDTVTKKDQEAFQSARRELNSLALTMSNNDVFQKFYKQFQNLESQRVTIKSDKNSIYGTMNRAFDHGDTRSIATILSDKSKWAKNRYDEFVKFYTSKNPKDREFLAQQYRYGNIKGQASFEKLVAQRDMNKLTSDAFNEDAKKMQNEGLFNQYIKDQENRLKKATANKPKLENNVKALKEQLSHIAQYNEDRSENSIYRDIEASLTAAEKIKDQNEKLETNLRRKIDNYNSNIGTRAGRKSLISDIKDTRTNDYLSWKQDDIDEMLRARKGSKKYQQGVEQSTWFKKLKSDLKNDTLVDNIDWNKRDHYNALALQETQQIQSILLDAKEVKKLVNQINAIKERYGEVTPEQIKQAEKDITALQEKRSKTSEFIGEGENKTRNPEYDAFSQQITEKIQFKNIGSQLLPKERSLVGILSRMQANGGWTSSEEVMQFIENYANANDEFDEKSQENALNHFMNSATTFTERIEAVSKAIDELNKKITEDRNNLAEAHENFDSVVNLSSEAAVNDKRTKLNARIKSINKDLENDKLPKYIIEAKQKERDDLQSEYDKTTYENLTASERMRGKDVVISRGMANDSMQSIKDAEEQLQRDEATLKELSEIKEKFIEERKKSEPTDKEIRSQIHENKTTMQNLIDSRQNQIEKLKAQKQNNASDNEWTSVTNALNAKRNSDSNSKLQNAIRENEQLKKEREEQLKAIEEIRAERKSESFGGIVGEDVFVSVEGKYNEIVETDAKINDIKKQQQEAINSIKSNSGIAEKGTELNSIFGTTNIGEFKDIIKGYRDYRDNVFKITGSSNPGYDDFKRGESRAKEAFKDNPMAYKIYNATEYGKTPMGSGHDSQYDAFNIEKVIGEARTGLESYNKLVSETTQAIQEKSKTFDNQMRQIESDLVQSLDLQNIYSDVEKQLNIAIAKYSKNGTALSMNNASDFVKLPKEIQQMFKTLWQLQNVAKMSGQNYLKSSYTIEKIGSNGEKQTYNPMYNPEWKGAINGAFGDSGYEKYEAERQNRINAIDLQIEKNNRTIESEKAKESQQVKSSNDDEIDSKIKELEKEIKDIKKEYNAKNKELRSHLSTNKNKLNMDSNTSKVTTNEKLVSTDSEINQTKTELNNERTLTDAKVIESNEGLKTSEAEVKTQTDDTITATKESTEAKKEKIITNQNLTESNEQLAKSENTAQVTGKVVTDTKQITSEQSIVTEKSDEAQATNNNATAIAEETENKKEQISVNAELAVSEERLQQSKKNVSARENTKVTNPLSGQYVNVTDENIAQLKAILNLTEKLNDKQMKSLFGNDFTSNINKLINGEKVDLSTFSQLVESINHSNMLVKSSNSNLSIPKGLGNKWKNAVDVINSIAKEQSYDEWIKNQENLLDKNGTLRPHYYQSPIIKASQQTPSDAFTIPVEDIQIKSDVTKAVSDQKNLQGEIQLSTEFANELSQALSSITENLMINVHIDDNQWKDISAIIDSMNDLSVSVTNVDELSSSLFNNMGNKAKEVTENIQGTTDAVENLEKATEETDETTDSNSPNNTKNKKKPRKNINQQQSKSRSTNNPTQNNGDSTINTPKDIVVNGRTVHFTTAGNVDMGEFSKFSREGKQIDTIRKAIESNSKLREMSENGDLNATYYWKTEKKKKKGKGKDESDNAEETRKGYIDFSGTVKDTNGVVSHIKYTFDLSKGTLSEPEIHSNMANNYTEAKNETKSLNATYVQLNSMIKDKISQFESNPRLSLFKNDENGNLIIDKSIDETSNEYKDAEKYLWALTKNQKEAISNYIDMLAQAKEDSDTINTSLKSGSENNKSAQDSIENLRDMVNKLKVLQDDVGRIDSGVFNRKSNNALNKWETQYAQNQAELFDEPGHERNFDNLSEFGRATLQSYREKLAKQHRLLDAQRNDSTGIITEKAQEEWSDLLKSMRGLLTDLKSNRSKSFVQGKGQIISGQSMSEADYSLLARDSAIAQQKLEELAQQVSHTEILESKLSNQNHTLSYSYLDMNKNVAKAKINIEDNGKTIRNNIISTTKRTSLLQKAVSSMSTKFAEIFRYLSAYQVFYGVLNSVKQGIAYVKELDSSFIEMQKVSNDSTAALNDFAKQSHEIAIEIGSTAQQIQNSAADWMRLGYSLKEASQLAKNTGILMNVSEFDNISEATESMVSMVQAFKDSDEDVGKLSGDIIDKLNNIGNNYSISTSELAQSLQRSAGTLISAGNDINKAIALTTAGNAILQNPESVGAGLKVISMRLRGTSTEELEAAGEDSDGLIKTVSKLDETIRKLTAINGKRGISLLDENGNYKDTYTFLQQLADSWEDIAKADKQDGQNRQAAILEAIAGELFCQKAQ